MIGSCAGARSRASSDPPLPTGQNIPHLGANDPSGAPDVPSLASLRQSAHEIRRRIFLGEICKRRRPRPRLGERDLVARIRAEPLIRLARGAAFLDAVEAPVRRRLVRER